ncbi:MAG: hypothetical protein LBV36_03340, partial [Chromatiales bacterium]|nr:hypothetical protein [Chromatiales bacterium]
SSLGIISQVALIGEIANTMVQEHGDLIDGSQGITPRDITECSNPAPDGVSNKINYQVISAGNPIPAGRELYIHLSECATKGVTLNGDIHIANLTDYRKDESGWYIEADIYLGPLQIRTENGTETSFTNHMHYIVSRQSTSMTTTLDISVDKDAGVSGGLNAQAYTGSVETATECVNYQLRPFRIASTFDPASANKYKIAVEPHVEAGSETKLADILIRYVTPSCGTLDKPSDSSKATSPEIQLIVKTDSQAGSGVQNTAAPVEWKDGPPSTYADFPVAGGISLTANCALTTRTNCGSVLALIGAGNSVGPGLVSLAISYEDPETNVLLGPVRRDVLWSELLNPLP